MNKGDTGNTRDEQVTSFFICIKQFSFNSSEKVQKVQDIPLHDIMRKT